MWMAFEIGGQVGRLPWAEPRGMGHGVKEGRGCGSCRMCVGSGRKVKGCRVLAVANGSQ